MKYLGLIGYPLTHSKSPKLHQLIGKRLNRILDYQLFDLRTIDDFNGLKQSLSLGKLKGLNVTIPYKESVIPFLEELTPKAKKIGAVNTIYLKEDKLFGDNTDYDGFKYIIDKVLKLHVVKDIVILGSGGAAKACYTVCEDLGFQPIIVSRGNKAKLTFKDVINYDELESISFDLIINATPIGMYPNVEQSPLSDHLVKDKIVIDLIYNPLETKLMQKAKHAYGGLDMLIVQAIVSQNIWFNEHIKIEKDLIEHIKEALHE